MTVINIEKHERHEATTCYYMFTTDLNRHAVQYFLENLEFVSCKLPRNLSN